MTPPELRTLILSDATATELAIAGSDDACAARCREIAPPLLVETRLSRLGILSLYANPTDGVAVLAAIDAVATENPLVAEIANFLEPNVHPSMLPDFGLPMLRAALTAPTNGGGLGLTSELAAPLLAAAERPQDITTDMVSVALRPLRHGDQPGPEHWLGDN